MDYAHLPSVNASLNTASALLLTLGYVFIRLRWIVAHRAAMTAAFLTSALFLISYITYHYVHGATRFQGEGWIRTLYFTILISHTILAVVIVPLILNTLWQAVRGRFDRHKRLARITLPLWLYVSVAGVTVYWMLYRL